MIYKSFEFNKINTSKSNYFLFYGENEGLKNETLEKNFKEKFKNKTHHYDENEILKDDKILFNSIMSKSFFDNEKLIIISRVSDKIYKTIAEIVEMQNEDVKVILIADKLEKKSKLRNFFEKEKKLVCVPFYSDNYQSLLYIAKDYFKKIKVPISQEILNVIIERSSGDRKNLKNELLKIESYFNDKKEIKFEDVLKLTNLSQNHNYSELVDFCLAKNKKKVISIINENHFSNDDTILIIRTFLSKVKRLAKLKDESNKNKSLEAVIASFKPPIFWKDKDLIKQQLRILTEDNISLLLQKVNNIELSMKKNYENSINILLDFIFRQSEPINNFS